MIGIGWIGLRSEIYEALGVQSKNELGEYRFRGDIIHGLDPEEIVLGDSAQYKPPGGKWQNLTTLMENSGYGSRVNVVC